MRPMRRPSRPIASLAALGTALLSFACSETPRSSTAPTLTVGSASRAASVGDSASYIVVLRPAIPPRAFAASQGLAPRFVYTHVLVGFSAPMSASAAAALEQNPNVEYVTPVLQVKLDSAGVEQHTRWALDRIDSHPRAYDSLYHFTASGQGVNAYDIDSGCRRTHVEFRTNRCRDGVDFVGDGYNLSDPTDDCLGHGSWTAGIIGGVEFGVAKSVVIHPVRVFGCSGTATTETVIAGMDWVATNGILPAVVNMSFGSDFDQASNDAVAHLISHGFFVSAAAGNGYGADACSKSPASLAEAVTVAASDSLDRWAWFSNGGPCVDIFAPGVQVTSAWNANDIVRGTFDGTSGAAPFVAGAGALWLETHPTATPAEVAVAIMQHATTGALTYLPAGSPNKLLYTLLDSSGTIEPPPPPPPPPAVYVEARFTWDCVRMTCSFDASQSASDSVIVSYDWRFGDGAVATGLTQSHTYAKPGAKQATLVVTVSGGFSALVTHTVKPSKR